MAILLSSYVSPVRIFDVCLIDHRVVHGGVYFYMTEQALDLLNGHAFINRTGGKRPAEFVRMHLLHIRFAANLFQAGFDAAIQQPFVGFRQGNIKRWLSVAATVKIILQMDFRPGVEVNHAFTAAFAEYDTLPLVKIDVLPVEIHQFAHTHSG